MRDRSAMLLRLFRITLWGLGGLFLAAVFSIAMLRLSYPFELEWMEGGTLMTVQRLMAGSALYVAPSVDFIPFIYTPGYFYLAAGLSKVFGSGFAILRLISLLASAGSMAMIFILVRRRTEEKFWSFCGAAFFAACFEISGGWFDLARVDSLYLFLLLLGVVLFDGPRKRFSLQLSAVVFVLAFLTKQSALLVLAPILAWVIFTERGRDRWLFPVITLGGILGSVLVLHFLSDGWFSFYVFSLPSAHEIAMPLIIEFWRFDLLAPVPFALLALFWLLLPTGQKAELKDKRWLLTIGVAFIGSAYFSRLHAGGWNNVLLPAYAILAVILATTLGKLFHAVEDKDAPAWNTRIVVQLMIYAVCILQFSLLIFDPRDHLPTVADRYAGFEFTKRLAKVDGEIWMPHHGWLAASITGKSSAHSMAIQDVLRGGDVAIAEKLEQEIISEIKAGRWSLILLDTPTFENEILTRYNQTTPAIPDPVSFWTVTGLRTRPEMVFELKDVSDPVPGPGVR